MTKSKSLFFGLKLFVLFILVTLLISGITLSLLLLSNIPQNYAKKSIHTLLSSKFNINASFQELKGNLYSDIIIKNIQIQSKNTNTPLLSIKTTKIQYNIFKLFFYNGNILKAADNIYIESPQYSIHRNKKGHWKRIISKKTTSSSTLSHYPFSGNIFIKNMTLHYIDEKGWKKDPLQIPFSTYAHSLNGALIVNKHHKGSLSLKGLYENTQNTFIIGGFIDLESLLYKVTFKTPDLALKKWGPYTIKANGYSHFEGLVDVDGFISSKTTQTKSKLPLFHNIELTLKNSQFKSPFFNQKITSINGNILLSTGVITAPTLQSIKRNPTTKSIQRALKKAQQLELISNENTINKNALEKLNTHKKKISQTDYNILAHTIKASSFVLYFNTLSGTINTIPITINGSLNKVDKWLNLSINTPPFESHLLEPLFPDIRPLNLSKPIQASLSIQKNKLNPIINASITSPALNCLSLPLKQVSSTLTFHNNTLKVNIQKASLFNGTLSGKQHISFSKKTPLISGELFISHIPLKSLAKHPTSTGNIDISITTTGSLSTINGTFLLSGNQSDVFNQSINTINGAYQFQNSHLSIPSATIYINSGITPITAKLDQLSSNLSIHLKGRNIFIFDPFTNLKEIPGNANLDMQVSVPITSTLTLETLEKKAETSIQFDIKNPTLYYKKFDTLSLTGTYQNKQLNLTQFQLKKDTGHINITGSLINQSPEHLTIKINQFKTQDIPLLTAIIPITFQPLKATVKAAISIQRDPKRNIFGKGTINITDVSIKSMKFHKISSHFQLNNNKTLLKNLSISSPLSSLTLSGIINHNNNHYQLHINPKSRIHISDVQSMTQSSETLDGILSISGSLQGKNTDYTLKSTLKSPYLTFRTTTIKNSLLSSTVKPNYIQLSQFKTSINDGTIHVKGKLKTDKNSIQSYTLSTQFDQLPINALLSIQKSIHTMTKTREKPSEKKPKSLQIQSPYQNKKSISIFSNTQSSELSFINSLQAELQKTIQTKTKLLSQTTGSLTGKLSLNGKKNTLPLLTGNTVITHLNTPYFKAKESTLTFKKKQNKTHFTFNFKTTKLNTKPLNSALVTGHITPHGTVTLSKNTLITPTQKIQNVLTGSLKLPLANTQSPHPINITVSLTPENSESLSYLNKQWSHLTAKNTAILTISGSLENPIINSKNTNSQSYTLHYETKQNHPHQLHITLPQLSITNNIFSFPKLNISHTNATTQQTKTLDLAGTFKLVQFNLPKPTFIISNVDLKAKNQRLDVNTSLYQGPLSIQTSHLSGPVIIPLKSLDINTLYKTNELSLPKLSAQLALQNVSLSFPTKKTSPNYPILTNLTIYIADNVLLEGPLFGNNVLGISADLEFSPTLIPIKINGPLNNLQMENKVFINDGNISVLNRSFTLLKPHKQQTYSQQTKADILDNSISIQQEIGPENQPILSPKLSLKALCIIENYQSSTQNTQLAYTHVIMTIDDSISNLEKITFDVYESNDFNPINASELSYINQYAITNDSLSDKDSLDQSDITELIKILIPELYQETGSNDLISTITQNQINTFIRRSILRPFEKNISKQIGLNDLKINYNIGQKLMEGSDEKLGIQFIRNILSDRLILKLNTNIDLANKDDQKTDSQVEVSEIELSYYPLKTKNLTLNLTNYKNDNEDSTYLSKLSARYRYDY